MFQDTLFTEPKMSAQKQEEYRFYNWQCVSLVRRNMTTLDLIVRDNTDLMTLLNVL